MPHSLLQSCDGDDERSVTPVMIDSIWRPRCESDVLATLGGCCSNGRRCDDVCIKVAAAYECQNASGASEDPYAGSPLTKCYDGQYLDRGSQCTDFCEQQVVPSKRNDTCCGDKSCQGTDYYMQKATNRSCGHYPIEDVELSNSGAQKIVEHSCDKLCGIAAKSLVEDKPKEMGKGPTYNSEHGAPEDSDDGKYINKEVEHDPQSTCYTSNMNTHNKEKATAEADHKCRNACCTEQDEQIGSKSSTFSKENKNNCCDSSGIASGQACCSHLDAAFKKYSMYLQIGRCICRSVFAPIETCCSKERRERAMRVQPVAVDRSYRPIHPSDRIREVAFPDKSIATCQIAPIGRDHGRVARPTGHLLRKRSDDIEKGRPDKTIHMAISISGMTCTSCSKKCLSVLDRITGVTGANINFVAGTGEFDLDCRLDPAKVVSQFEHETGFKCSRLIRDFQTLDISMSESEAKRLKDKALAGVRSVSKVDKKTYSVNFDPTLVGARSLLELVPLGSLAAQRNDSTLVSNKMRLVQMAWSTALAAALTIPVVVLAWSNNSIPYSKRSIVSLVLATLVQAIAVAEFYVGALKSLIFSKVVEMDMLVLISSTAAYGYSVVAFALTHRGYLLEQGEFFETASLLITLIMFGRLISAVARMKALSAVSMKSLQGETALLINKSRGPSKLDARLLEHGDTIMVPPHTRIITDGEIISGSSAIDESMITGENIPFLKRQGDTVIAGTMNGSSPLTIRLTRLPGQNSITDIANLVENALCTKPRVQDLADKVASWLILVVVGISLIVFALWAAIAFKVRNKNAGGGFGLAITYGIAVLAVSCPCALGLAVPMVLIIAGGVAAKFGIVIKQASATERAHRTTDVVFDKTGTLTTNVFKVTEEEYYDTSLHLAEVKSLILALLRGNSHPVSSAVTSWLQDQASTTIRLNGIQSILGAGVKATWNGKDVKAGNPWWLDIHARPEIREYMERGMTVVGVTVHTDLIAAYGLKSTLRPEATATIRDLHQRKVTCHIVSGDGSKAVEEAAQTVGIEQHNIASRQTPSSKQEYVKKLIDQGKTVLFCGDGTNDAVAVAQAHIGVQIGSMSDITRATAAVILTGGLDGIPTLLDISKQAYIRIVFNFVWSGIYNLFAILLAAGAFVKFRISPAYAGLGEIVSVLPVILVAMTLIRFKWKASRVNLETRLRQ